MHEDRDLESAGLRARSRVVLETGEPPTNQELTLYVTGERADRTAELTVDWSLSVLELLKRAVAEMQLSGNQSQLPAGP